MEEVVKTDTIRDPVEPDKAQTDLVKVWLDRISSAETFWKSRFKRMRDDMKLARLGASSEWVDGDNYTVPLIKRQINQAVATIYAKNPTFKVEPRRRIRFQVWDGTATQLQAAQMGALPNAMEILQDIQAVEEHEAMLGRLSKTTEIILDYYLNESEPNFKQQMKGLVRRTKTCGVAYLWLDYQRLLEKQPETAAQIDDITSKLALIERESADLNDGEIEQDSAEAQELRNNLADLEKQADVIAREGLIFDFIASDEILVDPRVKQLKNFVGARWISRIVHMTPDEVQETFGVDLKQNGFTSYRQTKDGTWNYGAASSGSSSDPSVESDDMACVYYVYDKKARQMMVLCAGYKDFLRAPAAPDVETEHFWPVIPLVLNEVADPEGIIPPSFASDMEHPQKEYNRVRQGLREHRIANRPAYGVGKGQLSDQDKEKLVNRPANAILELNALQPGQNPAEVLGALRPAPIDPMLYNTAEAIEDINRGAGSQDAAIGAATSGATATESSIADASRTKSDASDIDDIDEFMTTVARQAVQILLLQLNEITAKKIAGPGAVWPTLNRGDIVEELTMKIQAGSSGRPNAAAKLANMERAWPMLQAVPGVNPEPLIQEMGDLLDIDVERLHSAGLPSIMAMNAMMKPQGAGAGGPVTSDDPNQQGDQGANNAEQPEGSTPGGQPAFPAGKVVQSDSQGRRMVA